MIEFYIALIVIGVVIALIWLPRLIDWVARALRRWNAARNVSQAEKDATTKAEALANRTAAQAEAGTAAAVAQTAAATSQAVTDRLVAASQAATDRLVAARNAEAQANAAAPSAASGLFAKLFVGTDNRLSTSKTITVGWTAVIVFMILVLTWTTRNAGDTTSTGTLFGLLSQQQDVYLVLLGAPFLAAILAKIRVSNQVDGGAIKTSADVPTLVDLISNDTGDTDLYDFQYVFLNLVVMFVVIFQFSRNVSGGFPPLPDFLATLTGGSALTYTVNKWLNPITDMTPTIVRISPTHGKPGDPVVIYGGNLTFGNVSNPIDTQVKVGTVFSSSLTNISGTQITFIVPEPGQLTVSPGQSAPDPVDVTVTANNGMTQTLKAAWTYDPS